MAELDAAAISGWLYLNKAPNVLMYSFIRVLVQPWMLVIMARVQRERKGDGLIWVKVTILQKKIQTCGCFELKNKNKK